MVLEVEIKAVTELFMDPAPRYGPEGGGEIKAVAGPFMDPASLLVLKVEIKAVTDLFMDPTPPSWS